MATPKTTKKKPIVEEVKAVDVMKNAIKMFKSYDEATESMKSSEITDEVIDAIIGGENEIAKTLDAMILMTKIEAQRRLAATKKEDIAKTIIKRCMTRLGRTDREGTDGSITGTVAFKVEVDEEKIPERFKLYNWQKVQSELRENNGQPIPGVTVLMSYLDIRIK